MNRALLLAALGAGGYFAFRLLQPRFDFCDKHIVITGGSRGLGLVLARRLLDSGARLSICSRDPKELARAAEELHQRGGQVVAVECDVTSQDRIREFLAVARARNGPVDVLINNAGIIRVGPLEEMRLNDYDESLRVHFWAAHFATSEVIPEMKARRSGRIINITSIGGKVAVPHLLPYTVGKFALVGYSNGLRSELMRHGIVVTTICPGLMRTGSHINAEFKGRHEEEYTWFATGGSLPGLSMNAESAARKILAAAARGDAEVVIGLPFKIAALAQTLAPNLLYAAFDAANRWILPQPGGIGSARARGRDSRGKLPETVTALSDRASARNNELLAREQPPPVPARLS